MYPDINLFGITIHTYGLMIAIGVILAISLFAKRSKAEGYNEDHIFNLAIIAVVCGILGAKLLYLIVELPYIIKEPSVIIKEFGKGFVFYGGVIGGVLGAYIYVRSKKWPFLNLFDLAAPSIPLAQAFGRIGCFFAGCCYGRETSSPLGVEFNNSLIAPHDVSLMPTQLISSAGNFIIFAALMWFHKNKKFRDGQTGAMYMILYSTARFVIEFFRGDPRGTVFNILSTSQFICIFILAVGIILFVKAPAKVAAEEEIAEAEKTE